MPLLPHPEILNTHKEAVQAGLDKQRDALLAGMDPAYVAALQTNPSPNAQLLLDLSAMNAHGTIAAGVTPLHQWLNTASFLTAAFPSRQKFFADMAERVAVAAARGGGAGVQAGAGAPVVSDFIPQRIIIRSDLLPARFLHCALRTAGSIVRLVVPQIENGARRPAASSGEPASGYGTGWLIGPHHVITNWHVVEARSSKEPPPSMTDVELQCAGTAAEFDYDDQGAPAGFKRQVEALEHHHKTLDYAVLRLAAAVGVPERPPLPLRGSAFTVGPEEPFPVNIIQHPDGAAKQLGIRNNLAAALQGAELTYFTDTAGGSSGSPVCDDAWRVVALHRGARMVTKGLNFQGKDTAWVNVGTLIRLVVEDLRSKAPDLWARIGAKLV